MRTSSKAWAVLAAGVTAYEVLAPHGELLSEAVDRALERPIGKYAAIGAVAIVGCHLLNIFEHFHTESLDPIHQLGRLKPNGQ